jgi:hypothetical protein
MRLLLPLLLPPLLSGCCKPPADGALEEATWGGDGVALTVEADGSGTLALGCESGDLVDPIVVADGAFSVTLDWADAMADATMDTADDHIPATLEGSVCGRRIDATLTVDGGSPASLVLVRGREATHLFEECPQ